MISTPISNQSKSLELILFLHLNNGKNEKFIQDSINVSKGMIALGKKLNDFDNQCQGLI
jgi:hypothetical protein